MMTNKHRPTPLLKFYCQDYLKTSQAKVKKKNLMRVNLEFHNTVNVYTTIQYICTEKYSIMQSTVFHKRTVYFHSNLKGSIKNKGV